MTDFTLVDVAARLHDFEPVEIPQGLAGALHGTLDRIVDACLGRAYEFHDLVDVISHGWRSFALGERKQQLR
jgi:hypothetical protein